MKKPKSLDSLKKDRKVNVSNFVNPKEKPEELSELDREVLKIEEEIEKPQEIEEIKKDAEIENKKEKKKKNLWTKFMDLDRKKKLIIIISGVLILFLIMIGTFYAFLRPKKSGYTGDEVKVDISSSRNVNSGSNITYIIEFLNKEEVTLNDVELNLLYPSGFTFESSDPLPSNENNSLWKIGTIESNFDRKISITGKIIGAPGESKSATATVRFKPEGTSAEFQKSASWDITIAESPIILTIDVPKNAANGNVLDIKVNYENKGNTIKDAKLELEYPRGFTFESSIPSADELNKVWSIGEFTKAKAGEIKIRGTIVGDIDEEKVFKVQLGTMENNTFNSLIEAEDRVKIVQPALTIIQTVNGSKENIVNAGDDLNYEVKYKNTGNVGISNAVLSCKVDPILLDIDSLEVEGGNYNAGFITWNSSGVSGLGLLNPNDEGKAAFGIKIKEAMPTYSESDKNFEIKSQCSITSADVPELLGPNKKIEGNEVKTKINGKLTLLGEGRYYDYDGTQIGTGPLPPKVGKQTTYKIYLRVTNLTNDVENVEVVATLPIGVTWTGNSSVSHGKGMTYNPDSGKVLWDIGLVPANMGRFQKPMEAMFEVAITPTKQQVGQVVTLMSGAIVTGKDTFTGTDLEERVEEIDTELENDRKAKEKGKVVE